MTKVFPLGLVSSLLEDIRLGWQKFYNTGPIKKLVATNSQGHLSESSVTKKNCFITFRPERRRQHGRDLARRLLQPRPEDGLLHRSRTKAESEQSPRLLDPA
jgi:hypothetical protein